MSTENDATKTSSEDVVVDAPIIAEDDPTADGESMTSDAIVTGDDEEELSSTAPIEEEESKSVQDHDMADENDAKSVDENDGKSVATTATPGEEEEETKSVGTSVADNDNESATPNTPIESAQKEAAPTTDATADAADATEGAPPKKKRGKPQIPASARKGRAPAVKGLNIPFRTVKKAMKLDPDIPIVQNEAAIMTTLAAELFLKRLANQSQKICKNRGKNTIRYEDVADARANDPALAFLKTIIP